MQDTQNGRRSGVDDVNPCAPPPEGALVYSEITEVEVGSNTYYYLYFEVGAAGDAYTNQAGSSSVTITDSWTPGTSPVLVANF
jgi:hypothetical protein